MKEFEGKTAVVTGAASGIGLGLSEKFAKERMQVVMADIEEVALKKAVEKMKQYQHKVIGIHADVLIQESMEELFSKSKEEYGNIHILCNNAGIGANSGDKAIWEIEKTDWDWSLGVNFYGVLHGLQAFVPHMIKHGEEGHIVTTVSLAGLLAGSGTYGVSKHAALALTEGLSRDLITRNSKIKTSVLCPGFVNTNIMNSERNRPHNLARKKQYDTNEEALQVFNLLLKQGKEPSEIADIVFEGIKDNIFYILTHPAWDESLRSHFEDILARKELEPPSISNMADFFKSRDDGEKY